MFYHSSGRNQRPKGFKVKQAFQVVLLLAVCFWLLYQIKHSYDKAKDYGGSVQKKLINEHGGMVLGRKGNAGSSDGVEIDADDGNPRGGGENKEDGGAGDDELDRNTEEKAEEEPFRKGREYSQESINNNDERDDSETQYKELHSNEEHNTDTEVREGDEAVSSNEDKREEESLHKGREDSQESITNHLDEENEQKPETQHEEPLNNEKDNHGSEVIVIDDTVDSGKDKDGDENSEGNEEEIALLHNETESTFGPGQSEMGDGVHGYHDENGVPLDGHDLVNTNETTNDENTKTESLDQETILSLDNQTQVTEISIPTAEEFSNSSLANGNEKNVREMSTNSLVIEREEVISQEGSNASVPF